MIYTHDHADHTHGIDDLRMLCYMQRRRIDVWADPRTLAILRRRFDYCFETPPGSSYPAIVQGHVIEDLAPVTISGPGGDLGFSLSAKSTETSICLGYASGASPIRAI